MTALAASYDAKRKDGELIRYPLAAGVHVFKGALVCVSTTTGLLTPGADAAGVVCVGVAFEEANNGAGAVQYDGSIRECYELCGFTECFFFMFTECFFFMFTRKPERKPYPSDVSEDEWAFVAPYLTLMTQDAPQREHPLTPTARSLQRPALARANRLPLALPAK